MAYYRTLGQLPSKRHIQFRGPDGRLYAEEVFGTEGFVGPINHVSHPCPTQVMGWETCTAPSQSMWNGHDADATCEKHAVAAQGDLSRAEWCFSETPIAR